VVFVVMAGSGFMMIGNTYCWFTRRCFVVKLLHYGSLNVMIPLRPCY